MQEQEILRLEHYCHLLHLNKWDKNDITNYISAHKSYTEGKCSQEDYILALILTMNCKKENRINKRIILTLLAHVILYSGFAAIGCGFIGFLLAIIIWQD